MTSEALMSLDARTHLPTPSLEVTTKGRQVPLRRWDERCEGHDGREH